MKVLIIAMPRCGSTTLMKGLSKLYNCPYITEPWTENRIPSKLPFSFTLPDKVVVKSMAVHSPDDYKLGSLSAHIELAKNFDHTVLLGRLEKKAQIESFSHAVENFTDSAQWHSKYRFTNNTNTTKYEVYSELYDKSIELLTILSNSLNIPITWYEHLYSNVEEKVKSCLNLPNLNITFNDIQEYVDNKNKYRQDNISII